jgi:adenine-specific DNA-methyltransferase
MPFLQFKGRTAVESYHYSLPHHALELDAGLSLLADGQEPSLDGNLIVEGDNLVALKALLPTHAGRIKCIYIDPPYNTGEEAWVYNDNLNQPQFKEWIGSTVGKEGEDAARHDKWCCMMFPRLNILNQLLHDDGVIFVSIDDNEIHNLRTLMNEVFGESNFIVDFIWESRLNKDNRNVSGVSVDHEYVVCYGKKVRGAERDASQYSNPDDDPRGPWTSANMVGLLPQEKRPNLHYDLVNPETGIVYTKPRMGWRYDQSTMSRLISEGRILWPSDPTGRPRRKSFLHELNDKFTGLSSVVGRNVYTRDGTREVDQIFGERVFDFPKPTDLLIELIEQATEHDSIVLDSFAGSGTTGNAVLNLNLSDGGNRRFVLIQQPYEPKRSGDRHQPNICSTITAERVRRVIGGYPYTGNQVETLLEEKVGLNVLRKPAELLSRVERAKEDGKARFDDVRTEMKDGVVRVEGVRKVAEKTEGIPGTFTYARVSERPLLGDYRDFGDNLPPYDELAKYVYYTETSRDWEPSGMDRETGKIGEHGTSSYYLLYTPDRSSDWKLDLDFLNRVAAADPKRDIVIYHEKFWMHREQLHNWEKEHGKHVRSMHIPFQMR